MKYKFSIVIREKEVTANRFNYEFWLPFVVSVISLVITGIISFAANRIAETSMHINERNQYPYFQISSYYDEDNSFRGYYVTNKGGSVQFVHLEVDKYLHLNSIKTKTHDLIIPCAYCDVYYESPTEIMKLPIYQIREYDEFWLPTRDTIETNLLDTTSLLDTLESKLKINCYKAKYYTFNVLTVSYTDYNRVFHSERYLISSSPNSPNDYSLRFIDTDEWEQITLRIPSEFVDDEYIIPATAQNENGATTGGTVRAISYIDILVSDIINYMDSQENLLAAIDDLNPYPAKADAYAYENKGEATYTADFPCEQCGEYGVSIDEELLPLGKCCYCGYEHELMHCNRCGELVSEDAIENGFCPTCSSYIDKQ